MWVVIACKRNTHAIPVQPIRGSAVFGMRLPPMDNLYAIFFVNDTPIVSEVKLINFHVPSLTDRKEVKSIILKGQ